ncbi:PREDICTED: caspase-3-like isoform X2 [Amphimedon queenslandica]|uniref:Caspase family p20 domain-containing protein n=1 Tax=Amphimedon queenslandica TaxID=400682 RepID=A0AAN0JBN0_AMPQE|nr:PREDICTED: caspase-3-like isoform X2 [Amphimedon queenslandica]|eukprot:XP_019854399.1 PREDICTED: caspase-3-like isoform X2 [Amphimedon queenslandica]
MAEAAVGLSPKDEVERLVSSKPDALGIALIIANDYQNQPNNLRYIAGPHKDATKAVSVFESLGTVVYKVLNATAEEMRRSCQAVAQFHYNRKFQWIVVVFSGHGKADGVILGQDGNPIGVQLIVSLFQPECSVQNACIPKIFLFDMCRGEEILGSVLVPRGGSIIKPEVLPKIGNMLIAFSTLSNTRAFESEEGGVWLSRVLKHIGQDENSICDILNDVNKEVNEAYQDPNYKDAGTGKQAVQQPEQISTLHGNVYFLKEAKSRFFNQEEEMMETQDQLQEMSLEAAKMGNGPTTVSRNSGNSRLNKSLSDQGASIQPLSRSQAERSQSVPQDSSPTSLQPTAILNSKDPPAVQLKNLLVDRKKLKHPNYVEEEDPKKSKKKFRCEIYHSAFAENPIVGDFFRDKSSAKQDAAKKAMLLHQENKLLK